ncbi:MAG: DUF2958 domain-containing protein [Woeseia sp.]
MKLLTKSVREARLRNGRIREALAEEGTQEADFLPVVKLFTGCELHLTADRARSRRYRLPQARLRPHLGARIRARTGLPVERDLHFVAKHSIAVYAHAAWNAAAIIERPEALHLAAAALAAEGP